MIIVTGAAGFIGSCLVSRLNQLGYNDLVLVDNFSFSQKEPNYAPKKYTALVDRNNFLNWLEQNQEWVQFVFHLGARTDTTEFNKTIFDELNVDYSKNVWDACVKHAIPLVYASSAATYGLGELGYADDHSIIPRLKPLNPYGESKNEFDKWVLQQQKTPFFWAGIKFFNVFGPNEYHKGRMASVVFHAYNQIKSTGKVKLFRSHNPEYRDGYQLRDFVYVKDVADVLCFLMTHRKNSGIYNLGTGKARAFYDLALATFKAMGVQENIEFIDIPADIRDKYQYYTCAGMQKLRSIGYTKEFANLEHAVDDYVKHHLANTVYW
ncbi:MAG TPA: ADP-glyceromanno-heptose 6-epimerase [Flavobacteriales bacterium]|nr:ADP-glyceromanno-heptose 6-epimerase [Flavobacteriales bacterium]